MFSNMAVTQMTYIASTYGQGSYNAATYNGQSASQPTTQPTTQTTTPGAPNTGFFTSVISGQNEMWLLPILLAGAIIIGALVVGMKKLLRARKS